MHRPLRLRCDSAALISNYRALQKQSKTVVGAAIKANAYGLGAQQVGERLLQAGCRDFFVSTYAEAAELVGLPDESLAVLHGFQQSDEMLPSARPVLNSVEQVRRWRNSGASSRLCDVMLDTGMNRLGLRLDELAALDGLNIHTLHSHLACADEDHPLNDVQLRRFREATQLIRAQRYSLANSAGVFLGSNYAFDLVRPGLALYGGIPRAVAGKVIKPVFAVEAQVVQTRDVHGGETIGYNATYTADHFMRVAVVNVGYADGYWRAFSNIGTAELEGQALPVCGRVSMDLVTLDVTEVTEVVAGDWVRFSIDLPTASAQTGMSQYELLTGLGSRFERIWS